MCGKGGLKGVAKVGIGFMCVVVLLRRIVLMERDMAGSFEHERNVGGVCGGFVGCHVVLCVVVLSSIVRRYFCVLKVVARKLTMRSYCLTRKEREYVHGLLNEAVTSVQWRDLKECVAFVRNALFSRKETTLKLRQVVRDRMNQNGVKILQDMFTRHAGYKKLPCPLRGNALKEQAAQLGLLQRTMTVRVDTRTIREECELAQGRRDMKMSDEIGKNCIKVVMLRTKRMKCVQGIVQEAKEKGLADITRVWRDFQSCTKTMIEVCLEAIAAVATMKNVYVLDIHKLTCLFQYPVFKTMLNILTSSHIFAINMGEDAGVLDRQHFRLLSSKILDGSSPIRRWFVQLGGSRRQIVAECGLVKHNKPNVFALARREDKRLWKEGDRNSPRLAWLLAPESAFTIARKCNTALQDSTCNWDRATAVRQETDSEARLLTLASIATVIEH